ncbi:MAG: type II methionyl aminopeptidase [archaeon]
MEEDVLQAYLKAGKIAAEARTFGASLIKINAKLIDVTAAVEKKILELGGNFAFPPQISINSIAAHYAALPDETIIFKEGDVVKLDLGVHIDGYVADTAVTVDLGDNKDLVDASRNALAAALKLVRPGVTLGELGAAIQEQITAKGFTPIRNLSGHGLGRFIIHTSPSIPNIDTKDSAALVEDQVIAIEPFATTGMGMVQESGQASIFTLERKKPVRNAMTRDVLKDIEQYNGLPFSQRQLVLKQSPGKVAFALRELRQLDCLHEYPPLKERANGIVSQAEHSVIVREKPLTYTKDDA